MSWFPCLCGHRIHEHYLSTTRRDGPCKGADCSCRAFQANDPTARA